MNGIGGNNGEMGITIRALWTPADGMSDTPPRMEDVKPKTCERRYYYYDNSIVNYKLVVVV
jgi:hypothetical protein